jgi:cytochrome c553
MSLSFLPPLSAALLGAALLLASSANAQNKAAPAKPRAPAQVPAKPAAATAAAVPVGNVELGRVKADSERCMECHGTLGEGTQHSTGSEAKFARLAGQHPSYLRKQIDDFRSGARKHDIMTLMAKSLEPADIPDILAYFAAQKRVAGDGSDNAAGRKLYLEGDASRGIPACVACHGADGLGVIGGQVLAPVMAGQEWLYLERQLLDWRSGWRKNSDGGVMNAATKSLSDQEIKDVASFLSALR